MSADKLASFRDIINTILNEEKQASIERSHINTTLIRKDGFGEISQVDVTIYFKSKKDGDTWNHKVTDIEFDPPTKDKNELLDLGGPLTEHERHKLIHWFHRHKEDADDIASELSKTDSV
jgi:hypothetical protein